MTHLHVSRLIVLVALIVVDSRAFAQHAEGALPHDFDEPIKLYKVGLGTFTRPISSKSAEAQAYFNQGFQLMYGFARAEAGRSFREAQKRDPDCAICYWGEAWVWGPYISEGRTPEHETRAYAAIRKARTLANARADAKERAFIEAMGARYTGQFEGERRVAADRAYADAMARVAETYPTDVDAATLYAEALFLLLPRPGAFDIHDPDVSRVLSVLERALNRHPSCRSVPSVCAHDGVDERAAESRTLCGVSRECRSGCQPPQSHAGSHVDSSGTMGRRRACEPAGVAIRSEGRQR